MELEELDDSWIKEIENDEKIYNKFYTSNPNYVNLYIIYLSEDNSIVHIKTTTTSLNNNVFSKNKLIYYISKYSRFHKKRYRCFDIIKYNIDVDSKQIHNFIQYDNYQSYLTPVSKINDVYWKNSVEILHSINSLYIFYKPTTSTVETPRKGKNNTKKTRQSINKKTRKTT
jgi:hypothetical protein